MWWDARGEKVCRFEVCGWRWIKWGVDGRCKWQGNVVGAAGGEEVKERTSKIRLGGSGED